MYKTNLESIQMQVSTNINHNFFDLIYIYWFKP